MLKIASFLDLSFAKAVVSVEAPRFRDPAEALRSQCHPFSAPSKTTSESRFLARTKIPRVGGKKGKTQDHPFFPQDSFPSRNIPSQEKKSRFSKVWKSEHG